ncbi:MAG: hypothetical protein ACRDYE_01680, partial [Acidimicrobiales bacterium]
YTQFFTHLPAVLVGVHVLGASTVWAAVLWFHHGLSDHRPEAAELMSPPGVPMSTGRTDGPEDRLEGAASAAGAAGAASAAGAAGGARGMGPAAGEPRAGPVEPPLREPV